MVMVEEYRPGLQSPAEFGGAGKQGFDKGIAPLRSIKMRLLLVGSCGNHVGPRLKKPVLRSMGPVHFHPLMECAGTTALSFLECADATALWKPGRVPVWESGVASPHSKFRNIGVDAKINGVFPIHLVMECADASALWKPERVPVWESGDSSPHSKFGNR